MPVLNRTPHQNLILTGHSGVGKTAVGRRIAQKLGIDFYDVDNEIEIQEGLALAKIRELFGESRVQTLEARYIREIVLVRSAIIAVNGPALATPANLDLLQGSGPILCLTAALNEVLRRLHVARGANFHSPASRSIVLGQLRREQKVLELDLPQLDTTGLPVEAVVEKAIQFWMNAAQN